MDQLFLLKPGFIDNKVDQEGRKYYCPSCAAIEGVLSYYPQLREQVEIIYVDFPKPRKAIVELIGEEHQGCPVLVIDVKRLRVMNHTSVKEFNGKQFINTTVSIMEYLATAYQVGFPHP